MAYADQSMSSRRMVAIAAVVLFHAVIGYAFITGLAYNVVKQVAEDLKTFDVEEEPPPPPEEPPPPPPEQKFEPPPMVTPPPIVRSPIVVAPPMQTVREAPVQITIAAPTAPKPSMATPATPKGRPQNWLTTDDYPSSAMREGVQGVTGYRLDVSPDGRATGCNVTSSSGSSILDETTCRLLLRRARFSPAKDSAGNPLPSSYSGRTRWQIPEN